MTRLPLSTSLLSTSRGPYAPIGVFDSGLGGVSILRAIRTLLPREPLLFCADSHHAPYGGRDVHFIFQRSCALSAWLIEQSAKALVVACNTATAQVIEALRARYAVPVIGVEPGIKPAATLSKSRVVGVLATMRTLHSTRFRQLLRQHGSDCQFICQPGYGLVEAIEQGDTGSPELLQRLARYLSPMLAAGADTLVLGCTHYSFIADAIHQITNQRLRLIDTSAAVARQVKRMLARMDTLAPTNTHPYMHCYSTGDGRPQQYLLKTLLGIDTSILDITV